MVHQEQITFDTTGHRQMDDLTDQVAAMGQLVTDHAEKHGLRVDWDGSFDKRILLPDIDGKKRSDGA